MAAVKPMVRSGNSADIVYYGEPGPERPGRVWCDVLHSLPWTRDAGGQITLDRSKPETWRVTVYRTGEGQIAQLSYEPKGRPRGGSELPARTVTRLVREALHGQRDEREGT